MAAVEVIETAGEAAYARLRGDILFGRLAPGQRLRLEPLRAEYEVSIATLREALNRLAAEGLIFFEAQKGFEVAGVSARDLREISQMRSLLECHGVALSFARGDLDWEAGVVAAHHRLWRMEERMLAGDRSLTPLWKRYDREFHVALIASCGSRELLALHERIFDRFLRYQLLLVMFRGDVACGEHDALLAAALARDTEQAQAVLRGHIAACIDYTVSHGLLDEGGRPAAPGGRPEQGLTPGSSAKPESFAKPGSSAKSGGQP